MSKLLKRVVLPSFVAMSLVFGFTGCAEKATATEDNVITVDSLREEYMRSVGAEYEDTLIMDFSDRYDDEVAIYDSNDLTLDMLENRNGRVIIERCYGVVIDAENGAGKVLNPYDEDYDYISYSRCEGIREGTLMMTYLVYDPDTNYFDDIMERYDCVVSHELED